MDQKIDSVLEALDYYIDSSGESGDGCTGKGVYILQNGLFIKIGMTNKNIFERVRVQAIPGVVWLAGIPSKVPAEFEIFLHAFFEDYRVRRDWFRIDGPLKSFVFYLQAMNFSLGADSFVHVFDCGSFIFEEVKS